jgi:hypothetical protein
MKRRGRTLKTFVYSRFNHVKGLVVRVTLLNKWRSVSLQYKCGDDTNISDRPSKFNVPAESETEQFCKFQQLNKVLKPLSIKENLIAAEKAARALP